MSHDTTLTEIEAARLEDGGRMGGGAGADVESNGAGDATRGPERSVDAQAWAWATEHGAPERASTEQLVTWLARGELPPHTLVWRAGWGEWLPALQVAELASAFPSVTPGSRRVARAAFDAALTPPSVPVAHYPRLRLLAKDVLAESPLPPLSVASQRLAPAQAGRRGLRDLDHLQQDLVTSQVPAAAMLEAARAMKRLGTSSSRERWGRLDLGTFGEAPAQASSPSPRTRSPLALELSFPALLEPDPSDNPRPSSRGYGRWLLLGALVGGALGVLSVRVPAPEAAAPTVIAALSPALSPAPQDTPPAPPRASDSTSRALSSARESTSVVPPGAKKAALLPRVRSNRTP